MMEETPEHRGKSSADEAPPGKEAAESGLWRVIFDQCMLILMNNFDYFY